MIQMIFTMAEVAVGILLTVSILLQQKGSGLGAAFGGGSNIYSTKRGVDKFLFRASIALSVLFFGVGLVSVIVL